jgi:hypothetical protein
LRIVVATILRVLANPGRNRGVLQRHHNVFRGLRHGPTGNRRFQRVLLRQAVGQRGETRVLKPLGVTGDACQRVPFRFSETGDGDPTVVALARE